MAENSLINNSLRAYEPREVWRRKVRRRGYQQLLIIQAQFNLYYFWEKRWFFIAMALGLVIYGLFISLSLQLGPWKKYYKLD